MARIVFVVIGIGVIERMENVNAYNVFEKCKKVSLIDKL